MTVADSYEPMSGCHDASTHRVAMQGVVVSVEGDTATSTSFGHPAKISESGGQQLVEGTTLGTAAGALSSSLVIHSVRCAEIQWQR